MVQSRNDAKIEFSLVDITADIKENDQIIHLQAWKSTNNDDIIKSFKKISKQGINTSSKCFVVTIYQPPEGMEFTGMGESIQYCSSMGLSKPF